MWVADLVEHEGLHPDSVVLLVDVFALKPAFAFASRVICEWLRVPVHKQDIERPCIDDSDLKRTEMTRSAEQDIFGPCIPQYASKDVSFLRSEE